MAPRKDPIATTVLLWIVRGSIGGFAGILPALIITGVFDPFDRLGWRTYFLIGGAGFPIGAIVANIFWARLAPLVSRKIRGQDPFWKDRL